MPSREEVTYFNAGPASLPSEVLQEASKQLLNYNDCGIGLTEISHRSADANAILASTQKALRQLLDIPESDGPDGYQILFMQGGGSGGFSDVVSNLVSVWVAKELKALGGDEAKLRESVEKKLKLDYFVTGSWSLKASQEAARLIGGEKVNIVTDARKHRDGKFGLIPDASTWTQTPDTSSIALTYYCDNETVDGVEFPHAPSGLNLVADMSSNFLSRTINVRDHAIIFGGAQKNIGVTGITIYILSNRILPPHAEYASPSLMRRLGLSVAPIVFDYPTIAKNNSLYNTLPIFDVWIAGQVMQRLLHLHPTDGLRGQERESSHKSHLLYTVLDAHPGIYAVVPDKSCRSRMNLCFRIKGGDEDAEKLFVKGAEKQGLMGLKGHRSVGGIRVSNYNAVPVAAAEKLARYMEDFAKENHDQ